MPLSHLWVWMSQESLETTMHMHARPPVCLHAFLYSLASVNARPQGLQLDGRTDIKIDKGTHALAISSFSSS